MGIVYGFHRVTAAEYDRVLADPTGVDVVLAADRPADAKLYLDKSLWDLQILLDRAEVNVDLLFTGAHVARKWDQVSVWSAEDVASAAVCLRDVPFDRLARHIGDPPGANPLRTEDADYLGHYYESLVRFFVATAETRSPAIYSTG
jgi:hypothetical protein